MSNVTNVLLTAPGLAIPQVEKKLAAWAEASGCPPFRRVDIEAGGNKSMEAPVWAGAFNYMSLPQLLTDLCGDWKYPELVGGMQMLVRGQQDDVFHVYELHEGGWHEYERPSR